jgi:hypothetical protein
MEETVKHIPERGCHNCRLHYVNHKKCDSDFPCKQGGEWRPIISSEHHDNANVYGELKDYIKDNLDVLKFEIKQKADKNHAKI